MLRDRSAVAAVMKEDLVDTGLHPSAGILAKMSDSRSMFTTLGMYTRLRPATISSVFDISVVSLWSLWCTR